ncbi:MAG: hypothetical protein D3M94_03335 [Rhodocyclales bacterium GT-UBC]|nr:MAG: hypothetical protein D3M94_03335 [Rhodocyclales bacterium GT-UBC]
MNIYRQTVTSIFFALCVVTGVQANGAIYDNPHRVSGNLLIVSKRFSLEREQLDLRLNAIDYEARVSYSLRETAGGKRRPAASLYFPVVCGTVDEVAALEANSRLCLEAFEARIDGRPVPSHAISAAAVDGNKTLRALADTINRRARKNYQEVLPEIPSSYAFFRIDLPADRGVKTVAVRYKAGYAQVKSESSESSHRRFENARLIYDFFPAAAWMGAGDKELVIKLDTRNMRSALSYDRRQWPFVGSGNEAVLVLRNPDFAALPPLTLSTDNAGYQTFVADMRRLEDSASRYRVRVVDAAASATGHDDVGALFDRNPETFWCWQGKSALLEMELDPLVINSTDHPVDKVRHFFSAPLESFVILNGAVASKPAFDKYGQVRRIAIADDGADKLPGAELPMSIMASDKDRFRPLIRLADEAWGRNRPLFDALPQFSGPVTVADRARIAKQKLLFRITDVYKKPGTEESCISEIYPLYRDG